MDGIERILGKRSWLCAAVLAAAAAWLLREALFSGKGLVPADGIFIYPPWIGRGLPSNYLLADQFLTFQPLRHLFLDRLREGRLTLWNPYLACGLPLAASMQAALLFPIHILLAPLGPFYSTGWAAFLKLFLTGSFTLAYMRRIGISRAGALISSIAFSLSGYMIVWLGHPHVNSAMWLPLLLYAIEEGVDGAKGWALFSLGYGLAILGGHPPTVAHLTLFCSAYFLFRLRGTNRFSRTTLFLGALIAGVALSAAQLFPFLEYLRESAVSDASARIGRWATSLSPMTAFNWLLPYLTGSPTRGFEILNSALGISPADNFNERSAYIGIVPLGLAAAAVCYRVRAKDNTAIFFSASLALSVCAVYGLPPFPQLFGILPVFNAINPTRLLLIAVFSLAVLAGMGLDAITGPKRPTGLHRLGSAFTVICAASCFLAVSLIYARMRLLPGALAFFWLGQLPVFLCGLMVSWLLWLRAGSSTLRKVLCLGWVLIDLFWFGTGYNPAMSRLDYYPSTESIALISRTAGRHRVLGLGGALPPNSSMMFGLQDARGQDFIGLRRYEELVTGSAGDFSFFSSAAEIPPSLDLLDVKYVLSGARLSPAPKRLELIFDGKMSVYRNRRPLGRALPLFDYEVISDRSSLLERVRETGFDPQKTLLLEVEPIPLPANKPSSAIPTEARTKIVSYTEDEVKIDVSMPHPGFLLLLDSHYPGWKASVNAKPVRLYRADYNFRAVAVPAGRSIVRFEYRPASFRAGITLSLITLFALLAFFFRRRGRR